VVILWYIEQQLDCLSYQHSDPEYLNEVINKEPVKVDKWLRDNKLFINYSKTKF